MPIYVAQKKIFTFKAVFISFLCKCLQQKKNQYRNGMQVECTVMRLVNRNLTKFSVQSNRNKILSKMFQAYSNLLTRNTRMLTTTMLNVIACNCIVKSKIIQEFSSFCPQFTFNVVAWTSLPNFRLWQYNKIRC